MSCNLLLSFPRCGNSWVRYILEFITKRPTAYCSIEDGESDTIDKTDALKTDPLVDTTAKCIALKRHRADHEWDTWPLDTKLIVLVRDPCEAILRHHKDQNDFDDCVNGYLHCLEFFDSFEGDKLMVYYEDILENPFKEINKILDFYQVEKNHHYQEFVLDFDAHMKKSLKSYGASHTNGDKNRMRHHARMQPGVARKVRLALQKHPFKEKYLSRYV